MDDIVQKERERYRKVFGQRDKQKDYWTYSNCSSCYAECPNRIRVVDGKPVAVEGIPESGRGSGGYCTKGLGALIDRYDPHRVLYPVKRGNPKKGLYEDPKWERISWDEAMKTVAEKLGAIRKKDPRAFFFGMTPGPTGGMRANITFRRFMLAYGTKSMVNGGAGVMCGASAHHIGALHYVAWDMIPDYRYCNYVFRCGGAEGWGGGRISNASVRLAAEARARGMKMKVMDPQGFTSAYKGDEWIPVLPGTDGAVFLAQANLMVNEIGYDKDYIRYKTNGPYLVGPNRCYVRDKETGQPLLYDEADGKVKTWDDPTLTNPAIEGKFTANGVECRPAFALLKEHLKQYQPEWASKVSTVPASTIRRVAKELVEEARIGSFIEIDGVKVPYRPACVIGYKGVQTHSNSFHTYSALHLLNVLLGNQDTCGGLLGSGSAVSLGTPEAPHWVFSPYAGVDGLLTPGAWPTGAVYAAWPPRKVNGPGNHQGFLDVFSTSSANFYPLADDWDEHWDKAGRPFEAEAYLLYGSNMVMSVVRPESAERWLKKIPFIVALQPFHNETTEGFADVVLPLTDTYEALDVDSVFGVTFNGPIGLDPWSIHVRMPTVEPKGEVRDVTDVFMELADRIGMRNEYNMQLDEVLSFRETWQDRPEGKKVPRVIEPEDRSSNIEHVDKILKHHFGNNRGLSWFRDNGFMTWKKRPQECYWRWFVNARIPLYYEEIEAEKDEIRKRAESIGFNINWDYFTALTSYFPPATVNELPLDSEYDLFLISHHESFIYGRFNARNPYVNALALRNPYSYTVTMNAETGRKKGLKNGDTICLESRYGDKQTAEVRLSELIHPQVLAAVGLGSWARAAQNGRGKGINPNAFLRQEQNRCCFLSGSAEPNSRVKVYKKEGR